MSLGDPGPLLTSGMVGPVLALLICAHCLADFVFQSQTMARRKAQTRWLLFHAVQVFLLHAFFVIPFLSTIAVVSVIVITVTHILIDRAKVQLADSGFGPMPLFFVDQALHLIVLAITAEWIAGWSGSFPLLGPFVPYLSGLTTTSILIAGLAFNCNGGSALVSQVLERYHLPDTGPEERDDGAHLLKMGRTIGILERTVMLLLILVDQWGALGLVLAAKSLARFRDLDRRPFSEYYLIGTLTSVLVAVTSGLAIRYLV